ncbi:MAG: SH3 domain-containing protein [Geminicoccaceae bacterium]
MWEKRKTQVLKRSPNQKVCLGIVDGALTIVRIDGRAAAYDDAETFNFLKTKADAGIESQREQIAEQQRQIRSINNIDRILRLAFALPMIRLLLFPLVSWLEKRRALLEKRLGSHDEPSASRTSPAADLSFLLSESQMDAYEQTALAFNELSKSEKVWQLDVPPKSPLSYDRVDMTSEYPRHPCRLYHASFPGLQANGTAFALISDRAALYIYPFFCILIDKNGDVSSIPITQLNLAVTDVVYLEDEKEPGDAQVISMSRNRQIDPQRGGPLATSLPLVRYKAATFSGADGKRWVMMVSSEGRLFSFAKAFVQYARNVIKTETSSERFIEFEGQLHEEKSIVRNPDIPRKPRRWLFPVPDLMLAAVLFLLLFAEPQALTQAIPYLDEKKVEELRVGLKETGETALDTVLAWKETALDHWDDWRARFGEDSAAEMKPESPPETRDRLFDAAPAAQNIEQEDQTTVIIAEKEIKEPVRAPLLAEDRLQSPPVPPAPAIAEKAIEVLVASEPLITVLTEDRVASTSKTISEASPVFVRVSVVRANIRTRPEFDAPILRQAADGREFELLERRGEWLQILDGEKNFRGWVHESVVNEVDG